MRRVRAEVECDDCSSAFALYAPAPTPLAWVLQDLLRRAANAGWQAEGPSLMAGDLRPPCRRLANMPLPDRLHLHRHIA